MRKKLELNDMYSRGCNMLTQHTSIITYTCTHTPAHTKAQLVYLSKHFSVSEKLQKAPQVG